MSTKDKSQTQPQNEEVTVNSALIAELFASEEQFNEKLLTFKESVIANASKPYEEKASKAQSIWATIGSEAAKDYFSVIIDGLVKVPVSISNLTDYICSVGSVNFPIHKFLNINYFSTKVKAGEIPENSSNTAANVARRKIFEGFLSHCIHFAGQLSKFVKEENPAMSSSIQWRVEKEAEQAVDCAAYLISSGLITEQGAKLMSSAALKKLYKTATKPVVDAK